MLRKVFVPFGPWLPDQQAHTNAGALTAKNVVPAVDGYRPFQALAAASTNALNLYCRGAISVKDVAANVYTYAGSGTKLYRLSGVSFTDATRVAPGDYATATSDAWEFAKYGEKVIGVNFTDDPQVITLGGTNFAALGGSPPKARHIAVVRDFVVLGNINDGTNKTYTVAWSALGNEASWTPNPATQADTQALNGAGGAIQRIVGGEVGYIFQEHAITRMDYVGPPTIFSFSQVERNRGALTGGGVAIAGNIVFYLGPDDFYAFDGRSSANIGTQQVAQTFFSDLDIAYAYRITSAVDRKRSLVAWSYPGNANIGGQPNKIILYHWPTQRWSLAEIEANALFGGLSQGYTLDTLDTLSGSLDALPASLDSPLYQGGAITFAGFTSTHYLGSFSGAALAATIETPELELTPGQRSLLQAARPIVDGDAATVTVEFGARALQSAVTSFDAAASLSARSGQAFGRKEGRYHRVRVNISGGFIGAKGVECEYAGGGEL